jgi:hypothetical protein
MNSGHSSGPAGQARPIGPMSYEGPDYGIRALALWPRLDVHRLARVRHDRNRVAALVSRRTTLSYVAILELLGDASDGSDAPVRDH